MITTVLFDMGGTLEDIWVDEASEWAAIRGVEAILNAHGLPVSDSLDALKAKIDAGWANYARYREPSMRELKPEEIWCD